MSETPTNGVTPFWLSVLQDQISENHREVVRLLSAKVAREDCIYNRTAEQECHKATGIRLTILENKHNRLYIKLAILAGVVSGSGVVVQKVLAAIF